MSLFLDGRWIGVLRVCEIGHIFLLLVTAVVEGLQGRVGFAALVFGVAWANVMFLKDLPERRIRVLYIRRFLYKKSWAYVLKCAVLSMALRQTACMRILILYELVLAGSLFLRPRFRQLQCKTRCRRLYRKYSKTAIPEVTEEE